MADQSNYDDEDLALSLRRNWDHELEEEAAAEERARGASEPFGAPAAPAHELWFPRADRTVAMHMRGNYAKGYPVGAVVHFTAGRRERGDIDAEQTMKNGRDNRYLYFCISSTGKVYQPAALNKWGSHCGESSHVDLGRSLSNQLTGIEVCAAGRLKKTSLGYEPWWNDEYPAGSPKRTYYQEHEVRFTDRFEHAQEGHYLRYTPQQEKSLLDLLVWLHRTKPDVFKIKYIVGHDEISPGRKNDPGGAMSWYMNGLRQQIQTLASATGAGA